MNATRGINTCKSYDILYKKQNHGVRVSNNKERTYR